MNQLWYQEQLALQKLWIANYRNEFCRNLQVEVAEHEFELHCDHYIDGYTAVRCCTPIDGDSVVHHYFEPMIISNVTDEIKKLWIDKLCDTETFEQSLRNWDEANKNFNPPAPAGHGVFTLDEERMAEAFSGCNR